eukprot:TRINITY_DN6236_c0_g1_i1.p1 TRINITY_DN6236_c0_g1~~TRINITY_DN6236_c0_g1_i1.p1  ORF type:complete len:787 (-),score=209.43 TRINITY_DN6236_c0_g1_i1:219-2579(-)
MFDFDDLPDQTGAEKETLPAVNAREAHAEDSVATNGKLPTAPENRQANVEESIETKDLKVGQACRASLDQQDADRLLGELLRVSCPERYASYWKCIKEQNGHSDQAQQEEENHRKLKETEERARKTTEEEDERARKLRDEEDKARRLKEEAEANARKMREEEEEAARKLREEEERSRRLKEEEEERTRKIKEEEERLRKLKEEEETTRKLRQEAEERARKLKEEEEMARKLKEEEERARKLKEEEERARKLKEEDEKRSRELGEEEAQRSRKMKEEEERAEQRQPSFADLDEKARRAKLLELRASASKLRWQDNDNANESDEEAVGILGSLGRSLSLWSSVASIGFSFAMSSDPETAGKQIADMCRKQGGIYVKAAQMAASCPIAFAEPVLEQFQSLQDSADPQDWSQVEPRISKSLEHVGGLDLTFEHLEQEVLNAASIAQVHRGKLRSGEEVVVKVLRKNLAESFSKDTGNFLSMMSMYESVTGTPIKWMMDWSVMELRKEIDFRHEADLHEEQYNFVKGQKELNGRLAIPQLYSEFCSRRLLVMEYIDGCKITKAREIFPDWSSDRDLPQLHEALETWHAMQVFLSGKFHGDPHPGNVMIRRRKQVPRRKAGEPEPSPFEIVAIDHGGYFELSDEVRKQYAEVWQLMEEPKDEKQRLARRERLLEILKLWGIGHPTRFVLEQMFAGHMGSKDPTATIRENGDARRHRYNWMTQKRDPEDLGPPIFDDTTKMDPALMKACGCGNFTRSAWAKLAKGVRGWDFTTVRIKILIQWAKRAPGVRKIP